MEWIYVYICNNLSCMGWWRKPPYITNLPSLELQWNPFGFSFLGFRLFIDLKHITYDNINKKKINRAEILWEEDLTLFDKNVLKKKLMMKRNRRSWITFSMSDCLDEFIMNITDADLTNLRQEMITFFKDLLPHKDFR